jgi:integrase/recombinase XerC
MADGYRPDGSEWTDEELRAMDTDTSIDELRVRRHPVQAYLDRKRQFGKQEDYINNIERVLKEFEAFVYSEYDKHVCNVDDSHVTAFNDFLKSDRTYYTIRQRSGSPNDRQKMKQINISDISRHDNIGYLISFYKWLVESEGILSNNPARKALNDLPDDEFDLTPPNRPKIEMGEMREFLQWLPDPTTLAIILFLLKTGSRIGEAMNVDLSHLNLDHPAYYALLSKHDIDLVPSVAENPDSVYMRPKFQKGTEIDGEVRKWGNKRKRKSGSVVPVDDELKTALLGYISYKRLVTSQPSNPMPLFTKSNNLGESDRMTPSGIRILLTSAGKDEGYLSEYGWHESGASTESNVTPHYFRHYFTMNHKHHKGVYEDHMPKGVRMYIRGDVPDKSDVEDDNYDHEDWNDWDRFIKRPYLQSIYKFGLYYYFGG